MQEVNGYVKLFRKFKKWGWYQDNNVKSLFIHCLLSASYTDFEWMGKKYSSGSFITSIKHLSAELGITQKQVRRALDKLCESKELGKQTTNKFTVLTVNKWHNYQDYESEKGSQRTNQWQTEGNEKANGGQQYKNIKNKKNIVVNSAYPNVPKLADL